MFRPERMRLVAITALESHVELLTAAIAREKILHLVDAQRIPSLAGARPRERGRALLERSLKLEERVQDLVSRLGVPGGQRPKISLSYGAEGFLDRVETELNRIGASVGGAEARIAEARGQMVRCGELSLLLELVEGGDVTVEDLRSSVFDRVRLGFVETEELPRLRAALDRFPSVHAAGYAGGGRTAVCAATSASHEELLRRGLSSAGFVQVSLPEDLSGPISAAREEIEERRWEAREDEAESLGEIKRIAEERGVELAQWAVELAALGRIEGASLRYVTTGALEIIVGWIPRRLVGRLNAIVEKITGGKATVMEVPEAEAPPAPTELRNPPGVRAFESIVKLYGTPAYDGIDPTVFLALSFTLMFGVMFGDVGHGAVLLLGGLGIYHFFKPVSKAGADLGEVLAFCGVSSAAFGLAFGSVFGSDDLIPPLVYRLLDPDHPEYVNYTLVVALGIGVAMFSLGVILNVVQQLMRRRWRDALIGEWGLASLVFYWGLLGMLMYSIIVPDAPSFKLYTLLFLILGPPIILTAFRGPVGALAGTLTGRIKRGREKTGRARKGSSEEEDVMVTVIGAAIMVLETVTATFSHIRIAAFALNHAVLSMVVYLVADVIRDFGAGRGVQVGMIVMGNIVIIGLEGLIVFVQSMRLHFYEFFSKFFRELGTPYEPLGIE